MQTTNTISFSSRSCMWFKRFKLNPKHPTQFCPPSHQAAVSHLRDSLCAHYLWYIPHIMGKPSESVESSCSFLWVPKHPLHTALTMQSSGFCRSPPRKCPRRKQAAVPWAVCLLFWKRAVVSGALISFLKPQPTLWFLCVPFFPVCIFCQALKL